VSAYMKKKMTLAEKAEAALTEAVCGVVKDHMKTGRPLIVWENGKVVKADPHEVYKKYYAKKNLGQKLFHE